MSGNFSFSNIIAGALVGLAVSCTIEDKSPGPVKDIEGNTYRTIRIGDQLWMAENLRTGKFNDNTDIPLVEDSTAWSQLKTPGFCWYDNNKAGYKDTYGALYNGYTVNTGNLCPTGWHVPTHDEWNQLREFSGDTITAGGKLKETGTLYWKIPNTGAVNSTGFKALPAGIRYFEGSFSSISYFTAFWSSTVTGNNTSYYLSLYYRDAVARINKISQSDGLSIRCIKD